VDDERLVRTTLATLLRSADHTVHEASDGPSGLAQLAATPVDLVISDLGMPGMTGVEFAQAVKAAHPQLPVILLTGRGEQAIREMPPVGAVDRVLGKPIRLGDLLEVVAILSPATPEPDGRTTA
jgi:CheY-like chemotaxis protein